MDKFLKYYPRRCLECPELLNDVTAGDRCATCVERERTGDEEPEPAAEAAPPPVLEDKPAKDAA